MRLVDLEPRYFVRGEGGHPVGITFDCPCCVGKEHGSRLAVAIHMDGTNFDPDPDNPQQFETGETIWTVASGDSFDNISLTPSVDASGAGHWHGYITGGEIK
jgi:hypothetical protein